MRKMTYPYVLTNDSAQKEVTPVRQTLKKQLPLLAVWMDHQHSRELGEISSILDGHPEVLGWVCKDLTGGRRADTGREGLSAEQVLRAALVRQLFSLDYRELEFHLADSRAFRCFVRLGHGEYPRFTRLQHNIKKLRPETLEAINRLLVKTAQKEKIELGDKIRTDCTVVESNIHHPTDSTLLWDGVRVITRLMDRVSEAFSVCGWRYQDHRLRAKRRMLSIMQPSGKDKERVKARAYRDLLKVTEMTVRDGRIVAGQLLSLAQCPFSGAGLARWYSEKLTHFIGLTQKVMEQTRRRVVGGEKVRVAEKLVSLFEPHTDIIVKDRRKTLFGHKVCLTGGASSMILDCVIEEGNPADSTLVERMLLRTRGILGKTPRQTSFDGGFASKENLAKAKHLGVEDVAFHKKCGLTVPEMVKSSRVYRKLRNFRAGIEGCISTLKRAFGMDRCIWRGEESFKSYVWASIVSFNLMVMARHRLAKE